MKNLKTVILKKKILYWQALDLQIDIQIKSDNRHGDEWAQLLADTAEDGDTQRIWPARIRSSLRWPSAASIQVSWLQSSMAIAGSLTRPAFTLAAGKINIHLVACLVLYMHNWPRQLRVSMDGIVKTGTAITRYFQVFVIKHTPDRAFLLSLLRSSGSNGSNS